MMAKHITWYKIDVLIIIEDSIFCYTNNFRIIIDKCDTFYILECRYQYTTVPSTKYYNITLFIDNLQVFDMFDKREFWFELIWFKNDNASTETPHFCGAKVLWFTQALIQVIFLRQTPTNWQVAMWGQKKQLPLTHLFVWFFTQCLHKSWSPKIWTSAVITAHREQNVKL